MDENSADNLQDGSFEDFEEVFDTEVSRNLEIENTSFESDSFQDSQPDMKKQQDPNTNTDESNTEEEVNATLIDAKTEEGETLSEETGITAVEI